MREHLPHLSDSLFPRHLMFRVFVELINKLSAMHYHLLHGTFLKETAVIVTIDAVIVISTSIGVTAYLVLVDERHPAALTIFQIIFHSIKPEFSSHQFLISEPCRLLVSKAFYFILFIFGVGAFEEIHL